VKWLENKLKGEGLEKIINAVVEILSMMFLSIMPYYGMKLTVAAHDRSPILELPRHLWYLCIPLAGVIMIGYSIRNLVVVVREIRNSVFGKNKAKPKRM